MEHFWIDVEGHRLRSIYSSAAAADISAKFRDDGLTVTLSPAPNPATLTHGQDGHECDDMSDACVQAARFRGRARRIEANACVRDRLARERDRGEDAPNQACSCPRCMPRPGLGEI